MNILCKIFGHRMYYNGCDITGPTHCVRWLCKHIEPAKKWPRKIYPTPKSRHEMKKIYDKKQELKDNI